MTTKQVANIVESLDEQIKKAQARLDTAWEKRQKEELRRKKVEVLREQISEKEVEYKEIMERVQKLHVLIGSLISFGDKAEDLKKSKNAAVVAATEIKKDISRLETEISKLENNKVVVNKTDTEVKAEKPRFVQGFVNAPKVKKS